MRGGLFTSLCDVSPEVFFMRRHSMNRRSSKRSFSHGADRIHRKNMDSGSAFVMRGGIRL